MANTNTVKVKFQVVGFPKDTSKVFIVGNVPSLGNWDISKAVELHYYQNEGEPEMFTEEIKIPKDTVVEYKYVSDLADWNSVEKNIIHTDIANRTITTKSRSRIVDDKIINWR